MEKGKYYLFTQERHEDVRLSFGKGVIDKVINCWGEGLTYKQICKKVCLKEIELALIVMDLDYIGLLPERKGMFWGDENN